MHESKTSSKGAVGEQIACDFLTRKGFKILARNYRKPWGEIDVIGLKDGIVRFIEVKAVSVPSHAISRESTEFVPEEQIHHAKLRKIARTAELYMDANNDKREYQIDAVGVLMDIENRRARCRLFEQIL